MSSQHQYVTITHYKEREFYFLNYAIQTREGFIPKEIEQFHESDKSKFIERIRTIQSQYPNNQIVSISLMAKQSISQSEDRNRASAEIFKNNYVIQENIDVGDIPTTLYFSPFAILYQQYKEGLTDELKLLIGYFDRKLFMMFATSDKIHQSWIIGTRGLTEKQIAERVYKSMQAYYKISYSFADHLEMLVSDDSPKLLKVLREELSLHITLTQNSIHNLLHRMASSDEKAKSSFIKSYKKIEYIIHTEASSTAKGEESSPNRYERVRVADENLEDIKLQDQKSKGIIEKIKDLFRSSPAEMDSKTSFASLLPLILVLGMGGFFSMKNGTISNELMKKKVQITAQQNNLKLATISENIFHAMGKNAELKKATISTKGVDIRGLVWGIEPLKNSLNELYAEGKFVIKPLENFMTEFTFTSK
jgi:hypothetical protein